MSLLEATPPLRVIRAFDLDGGAALVHLHNVSGGLLGGDHLEMHIDVAANASAQVTTTSATRVYKRRDGMPDSVQLNQVSVGQNGLLEMLPDPLIPYANAAYTQRTRIDLADGAGLFWWETLAPGREAHGEVFQYERVAVEMDITAAGRPIAIESACLEPHRRPLTSAARMGAYRYLSTFYICRVGLPANQWTTLESDLAALAQSFSAADAVWGVGTLAAHGCVIRGLSTDSATITPRLFAFWDAARRALYAQPAIPPRKIY